MKQLDKCVEEEIQRRMAPLFRPMMFVKRQIVHAQQVTIDGSFAEVVQNAHHCHMCSALGAK